MDENVWIMQIQNYMKKVSDASQIDDTLKTLGHLLVPQHGVLCTQTQLCFHFSAARSYFLTGPYEELLYRLLYILSDVEIFNSNRKIISFMFVDGLAEISFEVLCTGISDKYGLVTNERCVQYLSQLVIARKLTDIITSKCSTDTFIFNGEHDSLVQAIVSLPDKAANRFQQNIPESLRRESYYPSLYKSILNSLNSVKVRLHDGLATSLLFISRLIGKLCLHGLAMDLWKVLLADIMINHDFLLSRVFHNVVTGIPVKAMDSSILSLLHCVHHYEDLSALLGNTIIDSKILQYLIMDKVLLHKFYTRADVGKLLYNVVGYLACSPTRIHMYQSTFSKLLNVWADGSSIKCVSYDQHFYISKAIIVCSSFLNEHSSEVFRMDLMKVLMTGLQNHLTNSDTAIRHTGMAVAEIVSPKLNPKVEQKLVFEYDSDEILSELKSLMTCPTQPGKYTYEVKSGVEVKTESVTQCQPSASPSTDEQEAGDLDSDDDLEPLGEFEDGVRSEKAPAYVGDCMQGLMCEERPERVEVCLKVASQLIRRNKVITEEVAVEFAKILLHMEGSLAIENYVIYRHESLVSLLVISPATVAQYLCEQFSARNYNVRQRLDMLDALAAGAMELSDPNAVHEQKTSTLVREMKNVNISETHNEPHWRQIVDSRIESKTRRFASASRPTEQGTANRFAAVAGHFFFPLLTAVRESEGDYNPLGADTILLVQYLYTLGKITASAQHCPLADRISAELLQVVWAFRCSKEKAVRRGAIFCIAMSIMVIPAKELLHHRCLADTGEYLTTLIEEDPDPEIKEMAIKVFSYFKQQFTRGVVQ